MDAVVEQAYSADRSLKGKLRRRVARLTHRRPGRLELDGPVVSFTFDDAPDSAVLDGAAILEEAGARGTFYVCAGLFGQSGPMGRYADRGQIAVAAGRGHEVGCHTFGHLDCGRADAATIAAEADRNAGVLTGAGFPPRHFAWPYGDVSPAGKRALDGRYGSLRALHPGLVESGSDLNQLPAVGIEGPDGEAVARAWIERAVSARAWLILYTHDVRDPASPWGCTPAALRRLVACAQARGAAVRTVGAVLAGDGA